jgi:hypothetical protein
MLAARLAYSLTLKMQTVRSSETSLKFYRTVRRYIPEDNTPHSQSCQNLEYSVVSLCRAVSDWLKTNQFVLAPTPSRITTRDFFL